MLVTQMNFIFNTKHMIHGIERIDLGDPKDVHGKVYTVNEY